eukprot:jgi/Chlat1/4892/Chrsp31S04907
MMPNINLAATEEKDEDEDEDEGAALVARGAMAPFRVEAVLDMDARTYFVERDTAAFQALQCKVLGLKDVVLLAAWDDGKVRWVRKKTVPNVPLPGPVQALLGNQDFAFIDTLGYPPVSVQAQASSFHVQFSTEPPVFKNRVHVEGKVTVEPVGPNRCRQVLQGVVDVNIPGVRKFVEPMVINSLQETYNGLPQVIEQWKKVRECCLAKRSQPVTSKDAQKGVSLEYKDYAVRSEKAESTTSVQAMQPTTVEAVPATAEDEFARLRMESGYSASAESSAVQEQAAGHQQGQSMGQQPADVKDFAQEPAEGPKFQNTHARKGGGGIRGALARMCVCLPARQQAQLAGRPSDIEEGASSDSDSEYYISQEQQDDIRQQLSSAPDDEGRSLAPAGERRPAALSEPSDPLDASITNTSNAQVTQQQALAPPQPAAASSNPIRTEVPAGDQRAEEDASRPQVALESTGGDDATVVTNTAPGPILDDPVSCPDDPAKISNPSVLDAAINMVQDGVNRAAAALGFTSTEDAQSDKPEEVEKSQAKEVEPSVQKETESETPAANPLEQRNQACEQRVSNVSSITSTQQENFSQQDVTRVQRVSESTSLPATPRPGGERKIQVMLAEAPEPLKGFGPQQHDVASLFANGEANMQGLLVRDVKDFSNAKSFRRNFSKISRSTSKRQVVYVHTSADILKAWNRAQRCWRKAFDNMPEIQPAKMSWRNKVGEESSGIANNRIVRMFMRSSKK